MKKQTKKSPTLIFGLKSLMPADPKLAKEKNQSKVLSTSKVATAPELARKIEAVGEAYAKLQGKFMRNQQRKENKGGIEDSEDSAADEDNEEVEVLDKKAIAKRMAEALENNDYYGLLGLSADQQFTIKEVTTAFRDVSLKYHPDKLKKKTPTAEDKENWLMVQTAYDTLIDPSKKKKYDSSLPFDDKIPAKDLAEDKFYEEYGNCFALNSKFSEI
jgi:hypothetical protein